MISEAASHLDFQRIETSTKGNGATMKFELGQIVSTPAALEAINESGQTPDFFIDRHVKGDWGDVCEEDKAANERALVEGERLL
jgi:hypothetical protein